MRIKKTDVRRATLSDVSMLNFLIRHCFLDVAGRFGITQENFPTHPSNSTVEIVRKDLTSGFSFFVKIDQGIPSGCVGLKKVSEDRCQVERLGVLPGRRHRGFGAELLKAALMEAKEMGAKQVTATIIAEDTELKRWSEKFGFMEIETCDVDNSPFKLTRMELPV